MGDETGDGADPGAVYLLGAAALLNCDLTDARATLWGPAVRTGGFGAALDAVADVDADGEADLLVGGPQATSTGAAWLIPSSVSGDVDVESVAIASFTGDASGDLAGIAVAALGDTDGDGVSEVAVAAPEADGVANWTGVVGVFSVDVGHVMLADADARLSGDATNDQAGLAVNGPGDVNGDGYDDVSTRPPHLPAHHPACDEVAYAWMPPSRASRQESGVSSWTRLTG